MSTTPEEVDDLDLADSDNPDPLDGAGLPVPYENGEPFNGVQDIVDEDRDAD